MVQVGALTPLRDFLDVRDVCVAYARCLDADVDLPTGTIVNIASGIPRQIKSVLQDLMALSTAPMRIATDTCRLRPSDIAVAGGDAVLAGRLLGWKPQIPWLTTLSDVLDDWRWRVRHEPSA